MKKGAGHDITEADNPLEDEFFLMMRKSIGQRILNHYIIFTSFTRCGHNDDLLKESHDMDRKHFRVQDYCDDCVFKKSGRDYSGEAV